MLDNETKRKLRLMNLSEFIDAYELQQTDERITSLPFDKRLQDIVDQVYQDKYDAKVKRIMNVSCGFPQLTFMIFIMTSIDR